MAVSTDRQVEWAGLLLDPPYRIQSVEGLLGLPELRTSDLARSTEDGEVPGVDLLAGRTVTITMIVDDETTADFATAVTNLQATLPPTGAERALVFKFPGIAGGNTARIWARARRAAGLVDTLYHQGASEVVVEFRATDPRIYAETEQTASIPPATPSGGHGFDVSFDHGFGGLGSAGVVTVTNSGNVAAPVVVTVNGPVIGPRVRNETTGEELQLDITLVAGEWVEFDSKQRTVMLNGTASRYHLLDVAQFWNLRPGSNELRFSADDPTGATATVRWRSTWI